MQSISTIGHQTRLRVRRPMAHVGRGLLAIVSLLGLQHAATAQGEQDSGYQTYQCVVLGDNAACPAPATQSLVRLEERIELGPIAQYNVHLGMNRDAAIELARKGGEHPTRRLVRVTTRVLTDQQKYDRLMGNSSYAATIEETVARGSVAGPDASRAAAETASGS
jgi:hypothetical protein